MSALAVIALSLVVIVVTAAICSGVTEKSPREVFTRTGPDNMGLSCLVTTSSTALSVMFGAGRLTVAGTEVFIWCHAVSTDFAVAGTSSSRPCTAFLVTILAPSR